MERHWLFLGFLSILLGMAVNATFKLNIPRRSLQCDWGGSRFASGDGYYSVVAEGEDGTYTRSDYCVSCWSRVDQRGEVYWKGKVPETKQKILYADLERDDRALAILQEMLVLGDKEACGEAFVLALYLVRQKKLFIRKVVKGQQLYEIPGTGEVLAVSKVPLSSLQVLDVQKKIAKRLSG
jgi:hypothetical protein